MTGPVSSAVDPREVSDRFYHRMASTCLAIAVVGFAPSYFVPLARGAGSWPLIIHLHGLLFFGWTVFLWWQSRQILRGAMRRHRAWGLFGIALGTTMVCAAFGVVAMRIGVHQQQGFAVEGRRFAWIGISDLLIFASLLGGSIARARRPETHKRLMLMATIALLGPPIGRWVLLALREFTNLPGATSGAPPPVTAGYVPHLLSFALVAVAMTRDVRTIGRVHPAYLVSFAAMGLQLITLTSIANSRAWQWIAGAIAGMAG